MTEDELRSQYPLISWDEPVSVLVVGQPRRLVCRYCIAMYGVVGHEVKDSKFAFDDEQAHQDHVRLTHHNGEGTQ